MSATLTPGETKPDSNPPGETRWPASQVAQPGLWVWSAVLLASMLACLAVSLVQVSRLLSPGWPGEYLVVLSFLVSLESILSWRGIGRRRFPEPAWFVYICAELILILLAVKAAQYSVYGFAALGQDLWLWTQDFAGYFFDGETVAVMAVLLVIWGGSRQMAADLALLDVDAQTLALEEESGISESRLAARDRLAVKILWMGAVMTLVVSLLHLDALAAWFYLPALRAGVYNLLAYFLLGLVLLSLTQYLTLRVEWLRQSLPVPAGLPVRWLLYSLAFIGLVTVVAARLPTGYSLGVLETLGYLVDALGIIVQILVGILLLPFLFLAWLLEQLLGRGRQAAPETGGRLPPMLNDPPAAPIPWLELLRTILFWLLLLTIVIGALVYYLRDRRELLSAARQYRLAALLINFWTWLAGVWRHASRQAAEAVGQGWRRMRRRMQARAARHPGGWLNLGRLSPRQRIVFYYLALLRRSEEQGTPRRPDQTPYEYMSELIKIIQLSPAEPERGIIVDNADPAQVTGQTTGPSSEEGLEQSIRSLTEQFVEARYSRHPISLHQASLAQRCWENIRRFLRRTKSM